MSTDAYFSNVTLLLHCDGADGSTTFTDVKGHTVTPSGGAAISEAKSKFGGASAAFDGSGDYLTVSSSSDFAFGPGDFTNELWVYPTSFTTFHNLLTFASQNWSLYSAASSGNLIFFDGSTDAITGGALTLNSWNYVALKRGSGSVTLTLNNTSYPPVTRTTNLTAANVLIGWYPSSSFYALGYIDEIRMTKSVARDVSSVPTEAFPDSGPPNDAIGGRIFEPRNGLLLPVHQLYL